MSKQPEKARPDHASRIQVAYDLIVDRVPRHARPEFERAWQELERGLGELWRPVDPSASGVGDTDRSEKQSTQPVRTEATDLSWLEELGELEEPELPARIRRIFPDIRTAAVRAARDHWPSEEAVHEAVTHETVSRRFRMTPPPEAIQVERLVHGWGLEERLVTTFETRYVRTRREPYQGETLSGDTLEGLWERPPRAESTVWRRRGSEKVEICPACRGRRHLGCDTCQGSGEVEGACARCGGTGRFGPAGDETAPQCPECSGSGQAPQPCPACEGDGSVECGRCSGSGSLLTYQEIEAAVREIPRHQRHGPEEVQEGWLARAGGIRLPERSWERPMISLGLTPPGDEIATRQRLSTSVIPMTRAFLQIEGVAIEGGPDADGPSRTEVWFVGVGSPVYGALKLRVDRRKIGIAVGATAGGLALLATLLLLAL